MKLHRIKEPFTFTPLVVLTAVFCCALWGSATPFIKLGYQLMLPDNNVPSTILFAGMRFTLAGIFTVLLFSIARKRFLLPTFADIPRIAVLSSFQTILQYIFFYIGLSNTSGVKGTIASGCSVFFAILISGTVFRMERITFKKIFACLLGFAGIVIVNLNGLTFDMNFTGDCFVLFSAMSSAVSSILIKRFSKYEDPVVLSGYQFIFGGTVMIAIGLIFGGRVSITGIKAVAILIYLALLSAVAYSLWGILLKYNPVSKVSIFNFTTPIFGVILSSLMLSESSNVSLPNLIITLLLVCSGIFILNYTPTGKNEQSS